MRILKSFGKHHAKVKIESTLFRPIWLALAAVFLAPLASPTLAQSSRHAGAASELPGHSDPQPGPALFESSSNAPYEASSISSLPEAPDPAADGGVPQRENVPYAADWHPVPFSRVAIGADINPLGIGIKSAVLLNRYFDARVMGNFFGLDTGRFEIEGFNVDANFHLASAAASLDWYPFNSVFRISPGLLFFNGNQISVVSDIVPGTKFSLNDQDFYSAKANFATGATPLNGTGLLGLHTNTPAVTIAGGFGKFIPRSNRHWSFPSEFGVAFTGAPTINVAPTGWICMDAAQTQCSSVNDTSSPIGAEFNSELQQALTKWRKSLSSLKVYPIFSYSVVYSFNIR